MKHMQEEMMGLGKEGRCTSKVKIPRRMYLVGASERRIIVTMKKGRHKGEGMEAHCSEDELGTSARHKG